MSVCILSPAYEYEYLAKCRLWSYRLLRSRPQSQCWDTFVRRDRIVSWKGIRFGRSFPRGFCSQPWPFQPESYRQKSRTYLEHARASSRKLFQSIILFVIKGKSQKAATMCWNWIPQIFSDPNLGGKYTCAKCWGSVCGKKMGASWPGCRISSERFWTRIWTNRTMAVDEDPSFN